MATVTDGNVTRQPYNDILAHENQRNKDDANYRQSFQLLTKPSDHIGVLVDFYAKAILSTPPVSAYENTLDTEDLINIYSLLVLLGYNRSESADWATSHHITKELLQSAPIVLPSEMTEMDGSPRWKRITKYFLDKLTDLYVTIDEPDIKELLISIADTMSSEGEFDAVATRYIKPISPETMVKSWQNAIKPFQRAIANRRYDEKRNQSAERNQSQSKTEVQYDWQAELKKLIDSDLTNVELTAELTKIASKARQNIGTIKEVFNLFNAERENELSRDENKNELQQIISATGQTINIESLFVPEVAKPILAYAKYLNVRPEVLVTAFLCGVSAVHKVNTSIFLHSDWSAYPNLFGMEVAEPGQLKSPVNRGVISKPINTIQDRADKEYESAMEEYKSLIKLYESLKGDERDQEFPEGEPEQPKRRAYLTTDLTMEGLFRQAQNQNHGQLIYVDELAGLINGMNQFKKGGNDAQRLLEAYDSDKLHITRAKDGTVSVKALISVWGGIQPAVIKEFFDKSNGDANGHWSRFLMIEQPFTTMKLTRSTTDIAGALSFVYDGIDQQPETTYTVSEKAFDLLIKANDSSWNVSQVRFKNSGYSTISQYIGKSRGRAVKLAVNLHCVNYAAKNHPIPSQIDERTMATAIALTDFYNCQAISLFSKLMGDKTSSLPANLSKIIDMAKSAKGHTVTARDVSNRAKITKTSGDALALFNELHKMGFGNVVSVGRSHKFTLNDTALTPNDLSLTLIDTTLTLDQNPRNPNKINTSEVFVGEIDTNDTKTQISDTALTPNDYNPPPDTLYMENSVNGVKEAETLTRSSFEQCQSSVNECQSRVNGVKPHRLTVDELDKLNGPIESTLINVRDGFIYPGVFSGFVGGVGTFRPTEKPGQSPIPVTRKSILDGNTELLINDCGELKQ